MTHAAVMAVFAAVLVVLAVIDYRTRRLPNVIVLPAAAFVLAAQIVLEPDRALEYVAAAAGASLFLLFPALIKPEGLGMGDVKLALLLGAALGRSVVAALLIGLVAAGLVGAAILARSGWGARKTTIPLGPFLALGGIAALFFSSATPVQAAVLRPQQKAPAAGALSQVPPAFAWSRVDKADRYEFQIKAAAAANVPALAGASDVITRNTWATLTKAIPNGAYSWRVRAAGVDGSLSAWTAWRPFEKRWTGQPILQTPTSGEALSFPSSPAVLRWSGVPGAAQYLVSVATDPALSSLVFHYSNQDDPNGPPNVAATSAAISSPLPTGTYYWGVTPVDAVGDRGTASQVNSFAWTWPAWTTPAVRDLDPAPEEYDPKLSWDPVPGAAAYQVEINPSVDFAPGSKVCCAGATIATSLSPTRVLKNDTYYWRVRALDPDGNAGPWNVGPSFKKTFDNVPPVASYAIKGLHMRDNLSDPGIDQDVSAPGYQTHVPVVTWDPVPGASSYEVDVVPFESGVCNWTGAGWRVVTAVDAWTPLGSGWNFVKPYSDPMPVATDLVPLHANTSYCVRVRARSDRDEQGDEVYGDYTYLNGRQSAFEWTVPSGPSSGTLSYPSASDYRTPVGGVTTRRTPYFTWKPIAGAQSYFVLVSRDQNFTSIVDYGFTQVPAYAPRTALTSRSYTDESTYYYWAVLPAKAPNGDLALGNPLFANAARFKKQSVPPTLISPAGGHTFADQPTFRWRPAEGARRYELQVATDTRFSNLLDDVTTDATSYSSNTTYPADTALYWRVRADDENLNGLSWSTIGAFRKTLAAPVPSPSNPSIGEMLPVWAWTPVQGASSYDLVIDEPNGTHKYFSGFRNPAVSFIKMTGTGVFHWQVRAEFPRSSGGEIPGPYSPLQSFTRVITAPANPRTDDAHNHVLLRWDAHLGAAQYAVQIARSSDFAQVIEQVTTDNSAYAPTMTGYGYRSGGPLYWRVAALDADGNQGVWTQPRRIRLQPRMFLSAFGTLQRGVRGKIVLHAGSASGAPLRHVRVRLTGVVPTARVKRTDVTGNATFKLRPRRTGKLVFTASKPGFQTEYAVVAVG